METAPPRALAEGGTRGAAPPPLTLATAKVELAAEASLPLLPATVDDDGIDERGPLMLALMDEDDAPPAPPNLWRAAMEGIAGCDALSEDDAVGGRGG